MNKFGLFLITIVTLTVTCSARNVFCRVCLWGVEIYKKFLRSDFMVNIYLKKNFEACMKEHNKEEYCIGNRDNIVVHEYKAEISYYYGEEICHDFGFCTDFKFVKDTSKSHAGKLLSKAPPATEYEGIGPSKEKPIRFIVVSDIHMDLGYEEVILNFIFRV